MVQKLKKLHKDYEKYIKNSKEGALQLIADVSVNYDGYNTVEKLKGLVDEIRAIALLGIKQINENISSISQYEKKYFPKASKEEAPETTVNDWVKSNKKGGSK